MSTKHSTLIISVLLTCSIDDLTRGVIYERSVNGGPWEWRGWSIGVCEFTDEVTDAQACWRAFAIGFDGQRSEASNTACVLPECHIQ